jgi:hypothetical protein
MNADIEHEILTRIATARQAFEELKRPIFSNRHIPIEGRLQLYNSLIISRLLYMVVPFGQMSRLRKYVSWRPSLLITIVALQTLVSGMELL